VEDLRAPTDREAFERVRQVSETGDALYGALLSPWVQAMSNPWFAEALKWAHPMRASRYLLSEAFNPWMRVVEVLATSIPKDRRALPEDQPLMQWERAFFQHLQDGVETARVIRDDLSGPLFDCIYGTGFIQSEARSHSSNQPHQKVKP
jgi:hypothetical protein